MSNLDERVETWTGVLRVRLVISVVLSLALLAIPAFGPHRFLPAAIALVLGLGSNSWHLMRLRRRGGPLSCTLAYLDVATVLLVLALAPQVYSAGATVLVTMTATFVFWFGTTHAARLLVLTAPALLALGAATQPARWGATWITWLLASVFVLWTLSDVRSAASASRRKYDELVNGIDAIVWVGNGPKGDASFVSDRVTEVLGYSVEQFSRTSFVASKVHSEDLEEFVSSRARIAEGTSVDVRYRLHDRWGRTRHLSEHVRVIVDRDRVRRRRGVVVDETQRWEAERSLRSYADFIEGVSVAMVILQLEEPWAAASLRVVAGNPAAAALVDRSVGEATGVRLVDLVPTTEPFLERLADVVRREEVLEQPFVRIGGSDRVYSIRAHPLAEQCVGMSIDDVTSQVEHAETLRHEAHHDHLTGLANRARFNARLERMLDAAGTGTGAGAEAAIIMVDLNDFKAVNDTLGHEYGDRLLVELAQRMSAELRGCDTVARLGGDEFAILVRDAGEDEALDVARRVTDLCGRPFQLDDHRLQVGASIGIALTPQHGSDAATLMRLADAAMYRSKQTHTDVTVHTPQHHVEDEHRLGLIAELRGGLGSDQFVVLYQPLIELSTMKTVGVEALVRWSHPERGLLSPSAFLELAETTGAIGRITEFVAERAVAEIRPIRSMPPLKVNVNLSLRSLRDERFVDWVAELIDAAGLGPSMLRFELTEVQLMDDPPTSLEVLHRLHGLGVGLSIDDFGTGYSSLAYLRELPVDELKIDRSFVAELQHGDRTIVRSVVELGHNLDVRVAAEGVESAAMLRLLQELGCDTAQGFHLAPPLSLAELTAYLDAPVLDTPVAAWDPSVTRR